MQFALPNLLRISPWLLLTIVLLTSCKQSSPLTRNINRPETVLIRISNSLIHIQDAIEACRPEFPELNIITSIDPNTPFDIHLRHGTGDHLVSAYFLAEDELVFIQSATNPADEISFSQISGLYTGPKDLPAGMTVWTYPEGDDLREVFNQIVLNKLPIRGEARLAPDPLSMVDQIASETHAVGYLPRSALQDGVQVISYPDSLAQVNSLPVIAVVAANASPGSAKLITCLQSGPGQIRLAELFTFRD